MEVRRPRCSLAMLVRVCWDLYREAQSTDITPREVQERAEELRRILRTLLNDVRNCDLPRWKKAARLGIIHFCIAVTLVAELIRPLPVRDRFRGNLWKAFFASGLKARQQFRLAISLLGGDPDNDPNDRSPRRLRLLFLCLGVVEQILGEGFNQASDEGYLGRHIHSIDLVPHGFVVDTTDLAASLETRGTYVGRIKMKKQPDCEWMNVSQEKFLEVLHAKLEIQYLRKMARQVARSFGFSEDASADLFQDMMVQVLRLREHVNQMTSLRRNAFCRRILLYLCHDQLRKQARSQLWHKAIAMEAVDSLGFTELDVAEELPLTVDRNSRSRMFAHVARKWAVDAILRIHRRKLGALEATKSFEFTRDRATQECLAFVEQWLARDDLESLACVERCVYIVPRDRLDEADVWTFVGSDDASSTAEGMYNIYGNAMKYGEATISRKGDY